MISKKQHELDLTKWYDSQNAGHDTCGSYDFCAYCNNEMENPCENALNTMNARNVSIQAEERQKETKEVKKSTTAKNTTAKKTTTTKNKISKTTTQGEKNTTKTSSYKPNTKKSTK